MCKRSKIEKALSILRKYPFYEKMAITQIYSQKLMDYNKLNIFSQLDDIVLPWEIETFAELSILATGNNPTKSFNSPRNTDFSKIITLIRNYMPPHLKKEKSRENFTNDFIMATGLVQFKCQYDIVTRLYRYNYFWSYKDHCIDMANTFKTQYNDLSYNNFIELAITIFFIASLPQKTCNAVRYICSKYSDVVALLTIDREEYISKQTEKNEGDINNSVYGFNYLYPFPFLKFQDDIFLPIPHLIIDAVSESLMTRATNDNYSLREDIGRYVAQSYLEFILKDGNIYEEVLPEIKYKIGKQTIDSPDVMVKDNNCFCFFDSKLSTPKLSLRKFNEKDIADNILKYANNICQVSELQFITVEAVRKGEATVSLKGKTRTVFIVKDLKKKLLCYIAEQKITEGAVFVTRTGKPISRTNIWREMKSLCEQANVNPNKVFPHNLRHLFARTFYGIEKDIAKLADILGHSSINTTRIYIVTTGDEHRRRMENMRLII